MTNGIILGFFDGIHVGHRELINRALKFLPNSDITVLTFKTSPSLYFNGTEEYIRTRKDSVSIIKNMGVNAEELDFGSIANTSAEKYLREVAEKYRPNAIFTGFNHTFGYNKSGNPEYLQKHEETYGYKYICVPPVKTDNTIISSTLIKQLLKDGNIKKANELLLEPFSVSGNVIKGSQIGRTIGFPTANIKYPEKIVHIPFGVYGVNISIDSKAYKGIMNWGRKPTLNNILEPIAEIHILNFDRDIYNLEIKADIINHIRSEKKFSSLEELKNQIEKDIQCLKL